ncbi:MAG TPA: lamin tail domain-containing protein [Methanothrix sp.]|nr:lamin tail domain-containing protein [Methanothrix sp.]
MPAVASSLSLSAPPEVDVSGEGAYEMNFVCSDDAHSLSALLQVPEGFSHAGNGKIILDGTQSPYEPYQSGQSLQWDLSSALKSCRHVVVNEWEQNPKGTDSAKEWIELFNPTTHEINIGGWKLVDSYYEKSVSIPQGTTIQPGDYLLLTWTNGSLINSKPTFISLLDSAGIEIDCTPAAKDGKNDNFCWARSPNGKDLDNDLEWKFQEATPGRSNDGSSADIYAGESLSLQFNLTADCSAPNQAQLSAEMLSSAGKISAPALPLNIGRANLSLSASPDRFDIAKGDEIVWTILLENDGDGTAYDIVVNATLSQGLQLLSKDLPGLNWSYSSLAPGQSEQVKFKASVIETQSTYSTLFQVCWGSGPCQEISQLSQLGTRTALRKQPDQPRSLAVGEVAGFEISADLPNGACDLWINDTIPRGLIYNEGSLSVQGLALQRELVTANSEGSQQVCWFFGDAGPAHQIEIVYKCLLENAPESQDASVLEGTTASMNWMEGMARKTDADEAGTLTVVEPELVLEMGAERPFAGPEDSISFTLAVYHSAQSHAAAFDVDLQALLPAGLAYEPGSAVLLSGPSAAFDAEDLRWHFDALDLDWNASQKTLLRLNATSRAQPGEQIKGSAQVAWTSLAGASLEERTGEGGLNDYLRETSAQVSVMDISVRMTADPDPVPVGELLTYTLTYENLGGGVAHNVSIIDELDSRVTFLSADPAPIESTWIISRLDQDGPHTIALQVRVKDTLPDGALLQNRFTICCDELRPKSGSIYTAVQNGTRLAVNKTALQKAVRRGEEVSYIIEVCNNGGRPATNVTVRDVFDSSVEIVSAWPEMGEEGVWQFERLDAGQCLQMGLTVRVPRTDVLYQSQQNVTGQGFVRTYRDYSTSRIPSSLTNHVYVSSDQMQLSASAKVLILAERGTELSQREHGSGEYESQEDLRFLTANKSIRLDRSVRAKHNPTALLLLGTSSQSISCLWHEVVWAKNGITNTSFEEAYRYSTSLDSENHLDLDENRSEMQIKSGFQGLAHLGTLKLPVNSTEHEGAIFSAEDFAGAFQVSESIHDLGQGLMMDRSVYGHGFVARDAEAQEMRSYESGTGAFRSVEQMDTFSGFMSKDLDASHYSLSCKVTPRTFLNVSQKWSEGMQLHSRSSLIAEEYSSATRLKKKAVAASPRELESEANFSGTAKLRTIYGKKYGKNQSLGVDLDETLMGDYVVLRRIILSSVAKYDRPHLYLRKDGQLAKDVATYTITITNDGNTTIGPLFLQDLFPPGARFLNATLRPNQIGSNSSNWTLLHLSIGDTVRIGINLNVEKCEGDIINRAFIVGNCSLGQVIAQNHSTIFREYLGCCLSKERSTVAEDDAVAAGLSCACWQPETSNETDYLNPTPMEMQWDSAAEEDGACPLSCPAVEDAHASVRS